MWEIANNYNVDFEQLKMLNPQLSSPDMIMPGMKIKIPSDAKPVKKENMKESMKEKEMVKTPYKDMSPKPLPVIKEDEKEQPMMKQPKPPMHQMEMPMMEQDMNQYTTINFSQMPSTSMPKKEGQYPQQKMKPMPMPQPQSQPQPCIQMVPMCCYPMPHGHCESPMHMNNMHMPQKQMPMHMPASMPSHKQHGCGCEGEKPPYQQKMSMNMHPEMPEMEMPKKPMYKNDEDYDDMMKPKYHDNGNKWNNMENYQHHSEQVSPQMGMNKGYGNPYPTPPGFQPFPTAPIRDDEENK